MRCFITGATGMVGAPVVRAFVAAGHEVVALTSAPARAATLQQLGATPVVGDMRDATPWREHVAAADAIVHCAQITGKGKISDAAAQLSADADAKAVELLQQHAGAQCRAFVYTSGCWVYGPTGTSPVDEAGSTANSHALVRYKIEHERRVLGGRVPGVVLRPAMVYGPSGVWANQYLKPMAKGKSAKMPGSGENVVAAIHEDDLAQAFLLAATKPTAGEIYNVADKEPVTLKTMVTEQAKHFGAKAPGGAPAFIIKLVLGKYLSPPLMSHNVLATQKIESRLGFQPRYPTYREGTAATAEAWKALGG